MGRVILKIEGFYLEYSTNVDAPVTNPMNLDEFKAHYKERLIADGMKELEERLERVEAKGTSAFDEDSWMSTVMCNSFGDDDTELDPAGFVAWVRAETAVSDNNRKEGSTNE